MASQNTRISPWSNSENLRVLISYWDEHKREFADDKTRGNAYAGAAAAIKIISGEDVSAKQIGNKMSKMWERNKSKRFKDNKSGYLAMFQIGSECIDLGTIGLIAEGSHGSTGRDATVDLQRLSITGSISAKPTQSQPVSDEQSGIIPEDRSIQHLEKENLLLKEKIKMLEEVENLRAQFSERYARGRGPTDDQVRFTVDKIIRLIRQNTYVFSSSTTNNAAWPSFSELETDCPRVYELYQQIYCLDPDDDLSLLRLASLDIQHVDNARALQAMVGMSILQRVLWSPFPDLFHDRGSIVLHYENLIKELFGQLAHEIFLRSALSSYIEDSRFVDHVIPIKAKSLSKVVGDMLWPIMARDKNNNKNSWIGSNVSSKGIWEDQERTLQTIFSEALVLRAILRLNPDCYDFFWPSPNTPYNNSEMRDEVGETEKGNTANNPVVSITLFPGISARDQESNGLQTSLDICREEGRRVIAKALVLLR